MECELSVIVRLQIGKGRRSLHHAPLPHLSRAMLQGKRVTTIEGLEQGSNLHALQTAFIEHDGFQCDFCTSGQIMSAVAVIEEAKAGWPSAATEDVRKPFTLADLSKKEIADERQSLPLRLLPEHRRRSCRSCREELRHAFLCAIESR
jgi:hypothetical protein